MRGTLDNAYVNLEALIKASGVSASYRRDVEVDENVGWFSFVLTIGRREVDVEVPACPLDLLTSELLAFVPRFYIDGSSWMFKFAVEILREMANEEASERASG